MADHPSIVILTGAGISAESGIATFRGPGGLWEGHRVEDVCTPEALARDPALVHRFYDLRRAALQSVAPNAAHKALARLDAEWPGDLLIVTQNVDDLHERAGSRRVLHMHGELLKARCLSCGAVHRWEGDLSVDTRCPDCKGGGAMRPDVVWFGEIPRYMSGIAGAIASADLFVSIGTSGSVYPAAGLVLEARALGVPCVELNLEPSENASAFAESHYGRAAEIVPDWVARCVAGFAQRTN